MCRRFCAPRAGPQRALEGPETLVRGRPYAVVGSLVIAAILTPPDPVTQLMLGIPLIGLYELGLLAARWQERVLGRRPENGAEDTDDNDSSGGGAVGADAVERGDDTAVPGPTNGGV